MWPFFSILTNNKIFDSCKSGFMSKTCLKCGKDFDDTSITDQLSQKYPSCSTCWAEWNTYSVMVINELRLVYVSPEHRKALRKHERMFFGLE